MPGLRVTADLARQRILTGPFPRNWYWSAAMDAPLFTKSARNPESLRALAGAGLQVSLFRPSTPAPGRPPSPDDDAPWNYGFVALRFEAGTETPQDLRTADVTLGGSLVYEHDQYHVLWFIPELSIAYAAVFCIDCGASADTNGDDSGWRADGRIGWNVPADRGWMPHVLKPLWLRLHGRAFRTSGLQSTDPARNGEGLWGSAELAYRCDRCGPVHEIYVRGNGGRLAQRLREKRAFTAGVSLFF